MEGNYPFNSTDNYPETPFAIGQIVTISKCHYGGLGKTARITGVFLPCFHYSVEFCGDDRQNEICEDYTYWHDAISGTPCGLPSGNYGLYPKSVLESTAVELTGKNARHCASDILSMLKSCSARIQREYLQRKLKQEKP